MRFKLDENLPVEAADLLRRAGHDALSVLNQSLGGEADRRIVELCRDERRILVTLDLDFGDVRNYPPGESHGLIVLRTRQQDKAHIIEILDRIIPLLEGEDLARKLWVVDEKRIRVRGEK